MKSTTANRKRTRRILYNTADPVFEARLKALKEVGKKVRKSPAYGLNS